MAYIIPLRGLTFLCALLLISQLLGIDSVTELESSWTCDNWVLPLYTGNCWVVWIRTKYWAGCCLLWKVSWFLSKWRGDNFCKPVQAESGPIRCSAGTVRFYTFCIFSQLFLRPLVSNLFLEFLFWLSFFSAHFSTSLHLRVTFFQCIPDCLISGI